MFPRQLLVLSQPSYRLSNNNCQIDSIVNSLELAVREKVLGGWQLIILPSFLEISTSTTSEEVFTDSIPESSGQIIDMSIFGHQESRNAFLRQKLDGNPLCLISSEGSVFAPSTVSELLKSVFSARDIYMTQTYPINRNNGSHSLSLPSVLVASERSYLGLAGIVNLHDFNRPVSEVIQQLITNRTLSSHEVTSAKSFDSMYSFEKTRYENV